jgi:hypothetical protein
MIFDLYGAALIALGVLTILVVVLSLFMSKPNRDKVLRWLWNRFLGV